MCSDVSSCSPVVDLFAGDVVALLPCVVDGLLDGEPLAVGVDGWFSVVALGEVLFDGAESLFDGVGFGVVVDEVGVMAEPGAPA